MRVIQASAPGRCGIVGNPSDIYGGVVLSSSIPARATCRLTLNGEDDLPEDLTLWNAVTARFPLKGVKVEWSTTVPRSSGLAGSTALLAATLACVLAARDETPKLGTARQLKQFAELVRDIERNEANVQCGYQDAYMVVHGGLQRMEFSGKHPEKAGPPATLASLDLQLPFVLVTTGVERLSGSVHGPVIERWLNNDPEVRSAIRKIARLGMAGCAALIKGQLDALAEAMNENQRLVAAMGGSGEAIDKLILDCRECGALGAKLAGAGLGGTVIALTEAPEELEAKLTERGYSQFMRPSIEPGLRFEEV